LRLGRPGADAESRRRRHGGHGLPGRQVRRGESGTLCDRPERTRGVDARAAAEGRPLPCEVDVVELAGVDEQAMADDLGLTGRDRQVGLALARRADTELAIDAPGLWITRIGWMVEDRDVREVVPRVD